MRDWAQGQHQKYQIASETRWFAKLSLAIELGEIDEAVLDRQRPLWIEHLALMVNARNAPASTSSGIVLPPGMRLQDTP